MGYWITKFGSTVLSTKAPQQEQGIGAAINLQELPGGGVHDPWGAARAPVRLPYSLPCTGTITADVEVEAAGISLTTHKHGGVQTGTSQTGVPV